ncbi:hypothetical protein NSQ43_13045 [Sporosarcina sp. FSL W8-0480]|uniref:hypothetical protein n=1 Tax=Sporosarcina sp. FSL W8-0480 TaxID=2954701 RepID=UPI0030D8B11E
MLMERLQTTPSEKKEGNEYSSVITNYILDTDSKFSASSKDSMGQVKEVKTYNANDLIQQVESVQEVLTPDDMTINSIPGGMTWVQSMYHDGWKLTGHLYREIITDRINYYAFDFLADTALSVIGTAIAVVYDAVIVVVATLLVSLGVGFSGANTTAPLAGWYEADKSHYNYLVQVDGYNVHRHSHQIISVIYYNQRNGKELRSNKYSSTHLPEYDILNIGIRKAAGF